MSSDTRRTVAQAATDELAAAAWSEIRKTLFRDVTDADERERLILRYAMRINEAVTGASWDEPTIAELAAWGWGAPDR